MSATLEEITRVTIDAFTGSIIVQGILIGLYTHLLFHTIVLAAPRLRRGLHIPLIVTLAILYVLNIINLAATWAMNKSIVVTHNETWQTMLAAIRDSSDGTLAQLMISTGYISILIADMLLVWRCYMLWARNKWLLVALSVPLVAQIAFVVILLMPSSEFLTAKYIKLDGIFTYASSFTSVGITTATTFLIVYRIVTISREAGTMSRYRYIIDVLIQSGILYSALNLIIAVTTILDSDGKSLSALVTYSYVSVILQSMTGIVPTMIFERVITGAEANEDKWSQPVSFLMFKKTTRNLGDTVSGRLNLDLEASRDNGGLESDAAGMMGRSDKAKLGTRMTATI